MSLFNTQEIGDTRLSRHTADLIRQPAPSASAALIPFPGPETRRTRRQPRSGEPRGEILLFLGVRYERLAS
jgi:hypothetical protein